MKLNEIASTEPGNDRFSINISFFHFLSVVLCSFVPVQVKWSVCPNSSHSLSPKALLTLKLTGLLTFTSLMVLTIPFILFSFFHPLGTVGDQNRLPPNVPQ